MKCKCLVCYQGRKQECPLWSHFDFIKSYFEKPVCWVIPLGSLLPFKYGNNQIQIKVITAVLINDSAGFLLPISGGRFRLASAIPILPRPALYLRPHTRQGHYEYTELMSTWEQWFTTAAPQKGWKSSKTSWTNKAKFKNFSASFVHSPNTDSQMKTLKPVQIFRSQG